MECGLLCEQRGAAATSAYVGAAATSAYVARSGAAATSAYVAHTTNTFWSPGPPFEGFIWKVLQTSVLNHKCDKIEDMNASARLQYFAHPLVFSTTDIQNLNLLSDVHTNAAWDTTNNSHVAASEACQQLV
jgi:hypothetical protein